ncbi:hypothetical protein GIB67_022191 [Kingdonia uniflora]|uniref:Uncharacterized protein n=1 Tax=Kingdonia uniflora TaxID=39325 RepID=A0A7J7MVZ1_9MAGN|nr:hypothetical protein GIB67_022191 [Kingdonia uniflora]
MIAKEASVKFKTKLPSDYETSRTVDIVIQAIGCQMLVKDSSQRLPLHKLLEHPWVVQNADPSGIYRV